MDNYSTGGAGVQIPDAKRPHPEWRQSLARSRSHRRATFGSVCCSSGKQRVWCEVMKLRFVTTLGTPRSVVRVEAMRLFLARVDVPRLLNPIKEETK